MPSRSSVIDDAAIAVAKYAQQLAPGPLAELRRMSAGGAPAFWRLAAHHPATIGGARQADWMDVVRMIAILTPRGDPSRRPPLHDRNRRLGTVLCDGGDPDPAWQPPAKFSERRLTQLIAARGGQRAALLERALRALARTRLPDAGVSVTDLTRAVLVGRDHAALLAAPYYRRLDRAERIANQTEDQSQGDSDA